MVFLAQENVQFLGSYDGSTTRKGTALSFDADAQNLVSGHLGGLTMIWSAHESLNLSWLQLLNRQIFKTHAKSERFWVKGEGGDVCAVEAMVYHGSLA